MLESIRMRMGSLSNARDAQFLQRFFKTGPGQYGEGDLFRGVRVPVLRKLSKEYWQISIEESVELLHSKYHEDRLLSLFILVLKYAKADESTRSAIYSIYIENTPYINNWDLVDASAEHIIGAHVFGGDPQPLFQLATSVNLWERRIAILATFHFIKRGVFNETLKIANILLCDKEDLIHKAVGWMLREIGKRDMNVERTFLDAHYLEMPRTMLRYSIEKFPQEQRQHYMNK